MQKLPLFTLVCSVWLIACEGELQVHDKKKDETNEDAGNKTTCTLKAYRGLGPTLALTRSHAPDLSHITPLSQLADGLEAHLRWIADGVYDVTFSYREVPFCDGGGRITTIGGQSVFKGELPSLVSETDLAGLRWDHFSKGLESEVLRQALPHATVQQVAEGKECIGQDGARVYAGRKFDVLAGGKPYSILLEGDRVRQVARQFVEAIGTLQVYQGHHKSGNLVTLNVSMQDHGYLCSDLLTTQVPEEVEPAFSKEFQFIYSPKTSQFEETSAFANASLMLEWFTNIDPEAHWSEAQVNLLLSDHKDDLKGGPAYTNPQVSSMVSRPTIILPSKMEADSLGIIALENLRTDFTVVAHEIGHHIIARYVSFADTVDNISIHEAFADFFVAAYTGNPCIGPSICPRTGGGCLDGDRCLRNLKNTIRFDDLEVQRSTSAHFRSQVPSAFLWQVYLTQGRTDEALRLVLATLRSLNRSTSPGDLVNTMLQVSDKEFGGRMTCSIMEIAERKGLSYLVSNPPTCS